MGSEAITDYGVYDLVDRLESCLGENLQTIVLTGSVARGEETDESDIDIWVVLSVIENLS